MKAECSLRMLNHLNLWLVGLFLAQFIPSTLAVDWPVPKATEPQPANVADPKTLRELALLEKVADRKTITDQDDPSLLTFGQALVHFIRERDAAIYEHEALASPARLWEQVQKMGLKGGPTREEYLQKLNSLLQPEVEVARSVADQMRDAGIDLKSAEIQIQQAAVGRPQPQGTPVSLERLIGEQFILKLAVKTEAKARNGTSLSGDYILAVDQVGRLGDDWKAMRRVHWQKLPEGLVDAQAAAALKFENYVSEFGTLPPGTPAPDIEFSALVGQKKLKLSQLRGKVVVLDFWATWCGPCQKPMADLQTLREHHADWQDKVAIVPISIDDSINIVQKHVNKHGWTNTFNVWAGEGGWRSAPALAFRLNAVPTTYIIDPQGKIITAGHAATLPIAERINGLLKP